METKRNGGVDEQSMRQIWRALGSYVAKQLTNGKGVIIPRFGSFTFTAAEVNLTVSQQSLTTKTRIVLVFTVISLLGNRERQILRVVTIRSASPSS